MTETIYVLARLRPGAVLADGRRAGERDRVVHVVVIDPGTFTDSTPVLYTACGCALRRGQAEHVTTFCGAPCIACMNIPPAHHAAAPHITRRGGVAPRN